jgi:multiple sugar transport system ATP-binding protein
MAGIELRNVQKAYGTHLALKDVSINVADGEFVALVGPSGCGKSTLLAVLAGLDEPTGGDVLIDGHSVMGVHPSRRDIAMVFQSYALYPSMTVRQNMGFGLEMRGVPKELRERRIGAVAEMLQIGHLLDRKPSQLSGGQRQRVAMGRALVREPKAFLFDEPLSNLDAQLRVEMRTEIKRLHQRLQTTTVYVTHDQIEAMTLADRIVVLRDGVIQQVGAPDEIYASPANTFVARFLGTPPMNLVEAEIAVEDGLPVARFGCAAAGRIPVPLNGSKALQQGSKILLGIRPEQISNEPVQRNGGLLSFIVDVVEPVGSDTFLLGTVGGAEIVARLGAKVGLAVGDVLQLSTTPGAALVFDRESGHRID